MHSAAVALNCLLVVLEIVTDDSNEENVRVLHNLYGHENFANTEKMALFSLLEVNVSGNFKSITTLMESVDANTGCKSTQVKINLNYIWYWMLKR